jgi:pimeloyl-ACP methyl ester carboxylesterase
LPAPDRAGEFIALTRAALVDGGLQRCETDGAVYFASGHGDAAGDTDGAGTLVLLHGVNDHAGSWFRVAPELARRHRVIVPDLAGHGESAPRNGPISIAAIVGAVEAIIDREDVNRLTLVGNSMGAWISILYALAHPSRVDQLVLESGGGLSLPLGVPLVAADRDQALTMLRAVHGPAAAIEEWMIDALMARSVESPMLRLTAPDLTRHAVDGRLGEIGIPTTLIWGSDDGVITRQYMETLHRGIAGASLHVIEHAGHIPHLQQPEPFLACLTAIS